MYFRKSVRCGNEIGFIFSLQNKNHYGRQSGDKPGLKVFEDKTNKAAGQSSGWGTGSVTALSLLKGDTSLKTYWRGLD